MARCWITLIASAGIVWFAGSSAADAAGMRPGYYAHSLLVFGNAGERYAAGCLRWVVQNRVWFNDCVGPRGRTVSAKY
jgi:hypothetical protein